MRLIEFDHPHRKRHFDFFRQMNHPHFNVCVPVDISVWLNAVQEKNRSLTPTLVWALCHALHAVPPMRQRIRGDQVVEHDYVHPSFAVDHQESGVFSFCEVKYTEDLPTFYEKAVKMIELRRREPRFEDELGRDDYIFMSALPWVNFTSIQHAMHYHPCDSIPRISWGKFTKEGNRTSIPVSIQVHHALVDGRHVGAFFSALESTLDWPEGFFG
jgi:chloramphenicol O-acetyltransferase type A